VCALELELLLKKLGFAALGFHADTARRLGLIGDRVTLPHSFDL
jgi:hypothetical protein